MKTPAAAKVTTSAPNSVKYIGADIHRQPRDIARPQLVCNIRAIDYEIPCDRIEVLVRDRRWRHHGVYHLSEIDHQRTQALRRELQSEVRCG